MGTAQIIALSVLGALALLFIVLIIVTNLSKKDSDKRTKRSSDDYGPRFTNRESDSISINEYRGLLGENEVDEIIQDVINSRGGENYKRIIIEDKYHNYTEIDNLYVSLYGIFIIETKSWSGNVVGLKEDKEWHSILGNGDIVHDKENPFIQNERHVNFFERVYHPRCNITPVVVFISHKLESIECRDVVLSSDLRRYLLSFDYQQMDQKEYEYLTGRLNALRDNPVMTHSEYAKWQKDRFKN